MTHLADEKTGQMEGLEATIRILKSLRDRKTELEQEIADLNAHLTLLIDKPVNYTDDYGRQWKVSTVRRNQSIVNLDLLRELDEDLYIDATKRVIDTEAWGNLKILGNITPDIATQVEYVKQNAPYIMFKQLGDASDEY
jgi:hypothetical protein